MEGLTNVEGAGEGVDNLLCADVVVEIQVATVVGTLLARSQG
jgi:hypothetical protein